jgi:hypothetical protein
MALFVSDDFHVYLQDLAFTGIWGGVYLIFFCALLKITSSIVHFSMGKVYPFKKKYLKFKRIRSGTITAMAVGGVIIGPILIGLYS